VDVLLGVIAFVVVLLVAVTLVKTVRIVPQQRNDIVQRLGRYNRTLDPGLHLLVPFMDKVYQRVNMREAVQSFPPQPVITSDNLVVSIDTVLYYRVVDSVRAVYEIVDYLQAIEQLTVTTLRNVIGSMDLEKALTSRDEINQHLSAVLDETTGRWGIKVTRVEIKAIEPPPSIRDSMEKQMRAERDRRAAILNAEGVKQAQILTADGDRQGAILRAQGEREARILQAEGQAKAIQTVFNAVHAADPDPKVLAYQYLQALPQIAAGQANKVWIIPAEMTKALEGIGASLSGLLPGATGVTAPVDVDAAPREAINEALAAARSAAEESEEATGLPRLAGAPASAESLLGDSAKQIEQADRDQQPEH
jgi:regulator of protease activity HflC (stomatin/prohibitin superfamily)